ncbi:hypothetical protein QYF36_002173 [Acer negundo]|nr:hypothetical protein QYF36_002173 [Acer negundo]
MARRLSNVASMFKGANSVIGRSVASSLLLRLVENHRQRLGATVQLWSFGEVGWERNREIEWRRQDWGFGGFELGRSFSLRKKKIEDQYLEEKFI